MNLWPNRNWLRFKLRTLFVIVTIAALALGWELSIVRARRTALAELRANPAAIVLPPAEVLFSTFPPVPWRTKLRQLMGNESVGYIRFDAGYPKSELAATKRMFPEARVSEKGPDIPVSDPRTPRNLPAAPINTR